MTCKGLHCDGCGKGGAAAVLAALVILGLILAAVARPVERTAGAVLHVLGDALEVVGLVLISATGAAALAALGLVVLHVRRRLAGRPAASVTYTVTPGVTRRRAPELGEHRPAIVPATRHAHLAKSLGHVPGRRLYAIPADDEREVNR